MQGESALPETGSLQALGSVSSCRPLWGKLSMSNAAEESESSVQGKKGAE